MARVASLPVAAKTISELLPTLQRMLEELESLRKLAAVQQEQIDELRKKAQDSV